jgi:D-beta-D-heptose 7-phosphate kinase/D-beta-D-heptose 1-phosphate adenosyltransferase
VIATIAFGLGAGLSLLEACQLANRAAGIVVGKLGAATVRLDELLDPPGHSGHGASTAPPRPPEAKLLSRAALQGEIARLRASARRIVFTNGCFDLLHAGHVQYLTQAARLGDVLVVGLNSDSSVRRLKGSTRPVNGEHDRAQVVAALAAVSFVTVFEEDTPLELITRLAPDVLVKGGDYKPDEIVGAELVRTRGGRVVILPFVEGRSTTQILARARLKVPT